MAASVKAGYAAAGTDTGHVGGNADFVAGHHEKLVDFAYRAIRDDGDREGGGERAL
jgi:hypothetical protein